MSEHEDRIHQPQPASRSPWTALVVERALAEKPYDISAELKQKFIAQLAEQLAALKEWDRFDPRYLPSVTLKRDYRVVAVLQGHTEQVDTISVLPDGRIVSGGWDKSIMVWREGDMGSWTSERLERHSRCVGTVHGLSDGRLLSSSHDGTFRFWSPTVNGFEPGPAIQLCSEITCSQVLPNGNVVSGLCNGDLVLSYPSRDGEWSSETIGATMYAVRSLQALPDQRFVTAHEDGVVRVWSKPDLGPWIYREAKVSDHPLYALQVLPHGRIVVAGGDSFIREVHVLDHERFSVTPIGGHDGEVRCFQALPDGRVVSRGGDNAVRIWQRDALGVWQQQVLGGNDAPPRALKVLSDGRILTTGRGNQILIWDGIPVSDRGAP